MALGVVRNRRAPGVAGGSGFIGAGFWVPVPGSGFWVCGPSEPQQPSNPDTGTRTRHPEPGTAPVRSRLRVLAAHVSDRPADRADAREARRRAARRRWIPLRAQMGRLPRASSFAAAPMCSSRAATRVRSIATFPICMTSSSSAAGRLHHRRRDRDRHASRSRFRCAAVAPASCGVARGEAGERDACRRSSRSICLRLTGATCVLSRNTSGARAWSGSSPTSSRRSISRRSRAIARWRRIGFRGLKAPVSTA